MSENKNSDEGHFPNFMSDWVGYLIVGPAILIFATIFFAPRLLQTIIFAVYSLSIQHSVVIASLVGVLALGVLIPPLILRISEIVSEAKVDDNHRD